MANDRRRPQQYRLGWPLTKEGVEHIDTMFETLFRQLARGSSSKSNVTVTSLIGPPGDEGAPGDDGGPGPPGPPGSAGPTGAAGPAGSIILVQDGIDGLDGWSIPVPGPIGATGAQGPPGPVMIFEGIDGDDGLMGPPGATGAAGAASGVFTTVVNLTDAQIRSLNTSPVTVIPAQGANTIIVPISWTMSMNVTAGFSSNPSTVLQYVGTTTQPTGSPSLSWTSTGKRVGLVYPAAAQLNLNGTTITLDNVGMQIKNSVDVTGGSTSAGVNITLHWYTMTYP